MKVTYSIKGAEMLHILEKCINNDCLGCYLNDKGCIFTVKALLHTAIEDERKYSVVVNYYKDGDSVVSNED